MSHSRLWLVAGLCALLSFGIPFTIINAMSSPDPEIRIIRTGQHLSALIVDGDDRLLVVQAHERGLARSLPGRLARPWEPDYRTVISPFRDEAAVGLLEVMRHPSVNHVIVAGVPGSHAVWSAVERDAKVNSTNVTYVGTPGVVHTERLQIEIAPAQSGNPAYLRIVRNESIMVMLLEPGDSPVPAHVTIGNSEAGEASAGLRVTLAATADTELEHAILVRSDETVTVIVESTRIRVAGGRYLPSLAPAN